MAGEARIPVVGEVGMKRCDAIGWLEPIGKFASHFL